MTVESGETGDQYHERLDATIAGLSLTLQEQGLDAALASAQAQEGGFRHSYRHMLQVATAKLFRTGDFTQQAPGLAYLEWEAVQFPDAEVAAGIAYDAKYDARNEEQLEFARRCLNVSSMHFRTLAQSPDFMPDVQIIENLNSTTSYMDEAGFSNMADATVAEFAPATLRAAYAYTPNPGGPEYGQFDYGKHTIDNALLRVSDVFETIDPETAREAEALISDPSSLSLLRHKQIDRAVAEAMFAEDFETARAVLAAAEGHNLNSIWEPMLERMLDGDDTNRFAWGQKVIDTILAANPEYFRTHANAPDIFYGHTEAVVVGLSRQHDVIDDLLQPEVDYQQTGLTSTGLAFGLGYRNDPVGRTRLMRRIRHYPPEVKQIVEANFSAGQQAALSN